LVTAIVANDLSASALQSMSISIERNGVENVIRPNNGDVRPYLYSLLEPKPPSRAYVGKFDVIDLDPDGSAAPFMDAAVHGINDGGLLCVTCTDDTVFASTVSQPGKAFASYGGSPLKGPLSQEGGLRLILSGIAMSAARFDFIIEPLLSLFIDSYARIFVRLHKSAAEVRLTGANAMIVFHCDAGCGSWEMQLLGEAEEKLDKKGNRIDFNFGIAQASVSAPKCEHCGFTTHLGGPMWAGPLHNPNFIQKMLDMLPTMDMETFSQIKVTLSTLIEENLDEIPNPELSPVIPRDTRRNYPPRLPIRLSAIAGVLRARPVPVDLFRGALFRLGYQSTGGQNSTCIRTDAPWLIIWEIMREWIRQKAKKNRAPLPAGTAGAEIMRKTSIIIKERSDTGT
jgi:tRNA (guanine26-N2/guanine27-N2)-dimethyltransferase